MVKNPFQGRNIPVLKILKQFSRYTTAIFLLALGATGLGVSFFNPMPLIVSVFPVGTALSVEGLFYLTPELIRESLLTQRGDPNLFYGTVGLSSLLLLMASILLVQRPIEALKTIGRGFKASPRAIWRSPITFYRKAASARNW